MVFPDCEVQTWAENRSCLNSQERKERGRFGGCGWGCLSVVPLLIANKQAARPLGGITPWGIARRGWLSGSASLTGRKGLADVPLSDVLLKLM